MSRQYTIRCDDLATKRIVDIACEYEITETEVIEQLVAIGLERRETGTH